MSELRQELLVFAMAPRVEALPRVAHWYDRAVHTLGARARAELVLQFAGLCEARSVPPGVLEFFLRTDPAPLVIATATIALLGVFPGSASEPLSGVHELVALGRQVAAAGDDLRASAILKGLVSVGDRRVLTIVGPCWRWLPLASRRELAEVGGQLAHAPLVEWLLDWLEECEGAEFGAVAAAVARMATTGATEVLEVHRAIPVWDAADGEVIRVQHTWTREEFAARLRPRLLQLAADEAPPRVMHDVLRSWGIDSNHRQMAGVFMRPAATPPPATPLGAILSAPNGASGLVPYQPLQADDFLAREGTLLLSWALFNPYGPTWSCLGLMATDTPTARALVYRVMNPFQQLGGVVGVVWSADFNDVGLIGRLTEELFHRNSPIGEAAEDVVMLGGGPPDVLLHHLEDDLFANHVLRGLQGSSRMRSFDLWQELEDRRASPRAPWARAARQRQRGLEQLHSAASGTLSHASTARPPASPAIIAEWFAEVTDDASMAVELSCFPDAWHGAIDHATGSMSQSAFTFWELEALLHRYGFAAFRVLARVRGGASMGEEIQE